MIYAINKSNVSEEEKIAIIEDACKSYSIIIRSAESITNIDATGCGPDEPNDNTKERLSINLDDIGYTIIENLEDTKNQYPMELQKDDRINNKIFHLSINFDI